MSETTFGNFVFGLAGLGLLRRWYTDEASEHRDTLVALASGYSDNDVLQFSFATPEHEAKDGYTLWAESYDGLNPMIEAEQTVVNPRLADLFEPGMVALDAGCGTGRHAATLAGLGYQVIGTDLTPAMLDTARTKVPTADFREGVFEDLPVDDNSVDLVTSALAVCHAENLDVVFTEFARVLRPGGRIIISDPHPSAGRHGGQAFFKADDSFDIPWVQNRPHAISDYVTAMLSAGFRIDAFTELPYTEAVIATNPAFSFFPEIVRAGLLGMPFVLIWEATLS